MPEILIATLPSAGHADPLLTVAADLMGRGNSVTVLTAAAHPGHQTEELRSALDERHPDAVIVDHGVTGIIPLLGAGLPPVLCYMPAPVMPASLRDVGALVDQLIVPTVPSFEYPHSDLPAAVRFVGVVRPRPPDGFVPPAWWGGLDGARPVVHVTLGTSETGDLSQLVEPTVTALADSDVSVVVSTGGRDVGALGAPVPANAVVADHLPHELLLPKVDVLVTDGDYTTVQLALAAGVPIVVAGRTGYRAEVAARVARSGAGINLQTGAPSPTAVAAAVHRVRGEAGFLRNARTMEAAFARRDGVAEIAALVDEVVGGRARPYVN
ncbi:MAG: nucleotide disphospho-sugar-binding domain-containing protein [Mycobacterium sp.]